MKKTIILLIIGLISLFLFSCTNSNIYAGTAEIKSRVIDKTLEGGALIYGAVYSYSNKDEISNYATYYIYTNDSIFYTKTHEGKFQLKVKTGIYNVICNLKPIEKEHTAILKKLQINPNEKIEIKFIYGETEW